MFSESFVIVRVLGTELTVACVLVPVKRSLFQYYQTLLNTYHGTILTESGPNVTYVDHDKVSLLSRIPPAEQCFCNFFALGLSMCIFVLNLD